MSAEILRRAAVKLREAAAAATPGPWQVDDETYAESIHAGEDHIAVVAGGRWGGEASVFNETADALFIALMHPPVALALADLFDGYAEEFDLPPFHGFKNLIDEQFVALARAVLREEAS